MNQLSIISQFWGDVDDRTTLKTYRLLYWIMAIQIRISTTNNFPVTGLMRQVGDKCFLPVGDIFHKFRTDIIDTYNSILYYKWKHIVKEHSP